MEGIPIEEDRPHPPPGRLGAAWKKTYERLLKIRGEPREISLGVALGLFVGMSPFMGLQTAISVFLASLLKGNKLAAAIGVWISNPLTAPVIYSATYMVGAGILGLGGAPPAAGEIETKGLPAMLLRGNEILVALVLGGILTGLPLAFMGYYFTLSAVRKYQAEIREKLARQRRRRALKKAVRRKRTRGRDSGKSP